MPNRKYYKEHIDFIAANINGMQYSKLTKIFNEHFNLNVTKKAVIAFANKNGLHNGLDTKIKNQMTRNGQKTQFQKGHIPINKGKKGMFNVGGNKTSFKPGHKPQNYRPIGSERIGVQGYAEIKIKDPKTWKMKHVIIWEEINGAVPSGYVVIFADGNKENLNIDNLLLISRRELLILNQKDLIKNDAELTRTGLLIADLHIKIYERKSSKKEA